LKKRAELQESIKKIDKQIELHEDAKAEFSKDLPTMKTNLASLVENINEKQVKKINQILTKKSPGTLIDGIESFVAVLRNHKAATNVDVELYFHDFSRLIYKLDNIDAGQLHIEVV
jgi:hypothetical protein